MTKLVKDMTPEELDRRRAYGKAWYKKNGRKKGAATPKKSAAAAAVLKIAPLRNGDDPGEALFYIADSLQVMNGHLKRIVDACEKAGGL